MVGRATLIVILGFSAIFGVASIWWTQESTKAVTNVEDYYNTAQSHNEAVIAANLACDSIFQNNADTSLLMSGLTGVFPDGNRYTIKAIMEPGTGNYRNCLITATCSYTDQFSIPYDTVVQVLLSPYSFSRYAFYTNRDTGVFWITGDTLTGPLQTNGSLFIKGVPVIKGPVTIGGKTYRDSVDRYGNGHIVLATLPDKYGDTLKCNSFKAGVVDSLPNQIDPVGTIGDTTKVFANSSNADTSHSYDVYLNFGTDSAGNGQVTETDTTRAHTSTIIDSTRNYNWSTGKYYYTYKYGWTWNVVSATSPTKIPLSSITNRSNEILILVDNGDAHVSGTVKGNVSVVANQPSSNYRQSYTSTNTSNPYFNYQMQSPTNAINQAAGNILIDGTVTYNGGLNGTDMLGLVASNSVMLGPQSGNVTIDAAIFALKGSFTYQDYNSGSALGYLNINGSITQNNRGAIGTFNSSTGTIATGYNKNYKYDSRFRYLAPPGFPLSHHYVVISWRE
jgi:hypothetical protein